MSNDIGLGLLSMAVCFDFRSTNVVQLSNRNQYFYQFWCNHPLLTQLISNPFILFLGGGLGTGWRLLDNGTYIRIYDSRSTSGGSAGGSGGSGGSGGLSVGSVNNNLNTIIGAAQGPGDYHGTISKSELEKEAEGAIFSSDTDETKNQIENTR